MCIPQISINCKILSYQYGPTFLKNAFSTLLNQCHVECKITHMRVLDINKISTSLVDHHDQYIDINIDIYILKQIQKTSFFVCLFACLFVFFSNQMHVN